MVLVAGGAPITVSAGLTAAVQTFALVQERRLKSPSSWTLQYWMEDAPLSATATFPPSAMPPVTVGTTCQVVLPGCCTVVPLSWLPQKPTPTTAS